MFNVKRLEENHGITWENLVELEPRLEGLLCQVELARPERDEHFDYERVWNRFKPRIGDLVGYFRHDKCDPRLKTVGAYQIAYYTLWHALHDTAPMNHAAVDKYLPAQEYDPDEHDLGPTCPDCGVWIGETHMDECDCETCTNCGDQWILCGCDEHDRQKAAWTGKSWW